MPLLELLDELALLLELLDELALLLELAIALELLGLAPPAAPISLVPPVPPVEDGSPDAVPPDPPAAQ